MKIFPSSIGSEHDDQFRHAYPGMDATQKSLLSGMLIPTDLNQEVSYRTPAVRHTRSRMKVPLHVQQWAVEQRKHTRYDADIQPILAPPRAARRRDAIHGVPLKARHNMWARFRHVPFHTDFSLSDAHAFVVWFVDIPVQSTFVLGQHSYEVHAGDLFVFDAVIPHAWCPPKDMDGVPEASVAFLACTPWTEALCRALGVHTLSYSEASNVRARTSYHKKLSTKLNRDTGLCVDH